MSLIKIENFRRTGNVRVKPETRLVNPRNICEVRVMTGANIARLGKWHAFEVVYTGTHSGYFYFDKRRNFDWALKQLMERA